MFFLIFLSGLSFGRLFTALLPKLVLGIPGETGIRCGLPLLFQLFACLFCLLSGGGQLDFQVFPLLSGIFHPFQQTAAVFLLPLQGILLFLLPLPAPLSETFGCCLDIQIPVQSALIAGHPVLQLPGQPRVGLTGQLAHRYRVIIDIFTDLPQKHPEITVLYGQPFSVRDTYQRSPHIIFIKAAFQSELLSSALEPEYAGKIRRSLPGLISAVTVRPGRTASLPRNTEQHAADKGMKRGFSAFIGAVHNVDAIPEGDLAVFQFSKALNINLCQFHCFVSISACTP